ncbi:hypothetical protein Tco_1539805, partial [Tanacetum coccineum]
LTSFETRDSLLEEFADELALLDPFPPKNEDVDVEAELREIEWLLNRDPSTNFSTTIMIDHNLEKFTDEFAPACLPPPGYDESFLKEDILEDVESKDSNVSNFDEPVLLNTPLSDKDECFDPGGDINKIDAFLDDYNDSEGDVLEILHNTTHNLFPEVFLDHDPKSLKDEPDNDDLMTKDEVFDPEVIEKKFSPLYVRLSSKDRHYLFFTIVFSFGSEDTIFDPGIFAFHFSSLEPMAFKYRVIFVDSILDNCFYSVSYLLMHLNTAFHTISLVRSMETFSTFEPKFKEFFVHKGTGDLLRNLDRLEWAIFRAVIAYGVLRMKEDEVHALKQTEKSLNKAIPHEHEIDISFKLQSKDVQMQEGKVDMESNGTMLDEQDTIVQMQEVKVLIWKVGKTMLERAGISSRSRKDAYTEDAVIRPVNDQVPLVESKDVQMQEGKVDMESSGTMLDEQDTSSMSRNDADTEDAVIRPVNDQVPLVEVQLTVQHDTLVNEQQHSVQSEPIYDKHLLEKVDRNTILDSTNMCHRGGEIDRMM